MKKFVVIFALILMATALAAPVVIGGVLRVDLAKYDPEPTQAGKIATVWIKAENIGTEAVKDTTFTLRSDYPFSLPNKDPTRNYGQISSGDDVLLEYKILVDP